MASHTKVAAARESSAALSEGFPQAGSYAQDPEDVLATHMAKYEDGSVIGSGGFGQVLRCRRDTDGQVFAKKRLQPGASTEAVARFVKEVRILASLDHPNVIRIVGRRLQAEPYFCILPLYKRSLRNELQSLVGDDVRIYEIFSQILDAMEYAHSEGVIHRDLKPENVLLDSDVDVVVADFGLGRVLTADSTRMTQTGYQMGTPLYMPPEQLGDAKTADERSDIFSLGRMLYELYSGPLLSAVQDTSNLPPGIAFIITRCTKPNPAERFQSVGDLKGAWHSLFDASYRQSELDELIALRAQLSAPGTILGDEVARFIVLLAKYQEDPDLLHETVMQLDANAVHIMFVKDSEFTRQLVRKFAELAASQEWGFSYTDRIGNVCRALYDAVEDAEVRAALIDCTMRVGVSHNRWHVLGIFGDMIQRPMNPGEDLAVRYRLEQVDSSVRERAAAYAVPARLHPNVRPLFEFESEED